MYLLFLLPQHVFMLALIILHRLARVATPSSTLRLQFVVMVSIE